MSNPVTGPVTAEVHLGQPITRGEQKIAQITLRKPMGGDLRGLSIQSLMQGDYNACRTLVPRIAMPQVLEADFDALPADDIAAFTGEIIGFFLSTETKGAIFAHMGMKEAPENASG